MGRKRTWDHGTRGNVRRAGGPGLFVFQRDPSLGGTEDVERVLREQPSNQLVDPFSEYYGGAGFGGNGIIKPPYNPNALMRLLQESNVLNQCVQAMVVNCEAFGHRLEYIGPEDAMESAEAEAEREWIEDLLSSPNGGEYDFIELRKRVRTDMETLGYGYIEVARNAKNDVDMMWHIPGQTMRMTGVDRNPTKVKVMIKRRGVEREVTVERRFRRFVQQIGTRQVFFKEYGDPRVIDPKTGKVDAGLALDQAATEVIHVPLHSTGQVYGVPRWINQLPAILGSRESELTNLEFFKDNAIPAMAVLVSGGSLTQDSLNIIEDHLNSVRGRKSINRIMVLEAMGDESAASEQGTIPAPRIDMKPMARERQGDELFQNYDANNQEKVRSSFRLPPIFIGKSSDYTRATARESLIVAENQVFGPERNAMDELINSRLLVVEGKTPVYWRVRTNPPRMVGADQISDSLDTLDALGAMTPNIAIGLANEMFDLTIDTIESEWGNMPFELVKLLVQRGYVLEGMDGLYDALPPDDGTQTDGGNAQQAQAVAGLRALRQLPVTTTRTRKRRGAGRARTLRCA